jgi:hypothetical protein
MSCCCTNNYPLCDMPACDDLGIDLTPFVAAMDGEHELQISYLGSVLILKKTFSTGDAIIFPSHDLNENFEYNAKLYDPNDELMLLSVEGNETLFDCVTFKIKQVYELN